MDPEAVAAQRLSDAFAAIAYHGRTSPAAPLSPPALRALHRVAMAENATVGDIAAYLGCAQSTASEVVGRLAARGLVRRTRRPDDERVVELSLTDAGDIALGEQAGLDVSRLAGCLAAMAPEERHQVERGFAVLLGHLEATEDP